MGSYYGNVYTQELFELKWGYPLWDPEPVGEDSEIHIGDVGFLDHRGLFCPAFNVLPPGTFRDGEFAGSNRAAEGKLHPEGHPPGLAPFSASHIKHCFERPAAMAPGFHGHKWETINADISEGRTVNRKADEGPWIRATEDRAAGLIIWKHADRKELIRGRRLSNYIAQNHKEWYEYLTEEREIYLPKSEDVLIITGWVKTGKWATVVYVSDGKNIQVSLSGGWDGVPMNISASRAGYATTPPCYITGPRLFPVDGGRPNQAVFIKFSKVRQRVLRWWPKVVQGAADPQDLSRRPGDPEGAVASSEEEVVDMEWPVSNESEGWDPVGDILTYILKNSDAEKAIASVDDVYNVCNSEDLSDIIGLLQSKQPVIDVTEGIGMLSFDQSISHWLNVPNEDLPQASVTVQGDSSGTAVEISPAASPPLATAVIEPPTSHLWPGFSKEDKKHGILPHDDNDGGIPALGTVARMTSPTSGLSRMSRAVVSL